MATNEQANARAADLAEWIVDEISEADRDWRTIEAHARELLELLAVLAGCAAARGAAAKTCPQTDEKALSAYDIQAERDEPAPIKVLETSVS